MVCTFSFHHSPNLVYLPENVLNTIQEDPEAEWPLTFEVITPRELKSYCGVKMFTATPGRAYIPNSMMKNLMIEEGTPLRFRLVFLVGIRLTWNLGQLTSWNTGHLPSSVQDVLWHWRRSSCTVCHWLYLPESVDWLTCFNIIPQSQLGMQFLFLTEERYTYLT